MGKPSTINPQRTLRPLRMSLLLCLSAVMLHSSPAQTSSPISALTVPLLLPSALAYDVQGNLYIAETGSHRIRKVDPTGIITTVAGTGTQGYAGDGGAALSASLDSPQGIAVDSTQAIYLSDTHNHRIRKVNLATGVITTIAGNGSAAFSGDGSAASQAALDLPTALALDINHNLYVADSANHRIRRIDATTGIITTLAGSGIQGFSGDNGPALQASIDSPTGLAVDASGNLYLADTHNHRLRRVDASTGVITTIAGNGVASYAGDSAAANTASLALPKGLAVDASGNLYLADSANHRIRRVDGATGIITTVVGQGTEAYLGDASVAPNGVLSFADTGNQRVRQLAPDATVSTIVGIGNINPGNLTLSAPAVIAYGSGQIVASLSVSTVATGTINFFDTYRSSTVSLGSAGLTQDTAILNTANLPAGTHSIVATYAGDASHSSAQSNAFTLTVTPLQLTATVAPTAILYGQPLPALSGTLSGMLPQDASGVSLTLTSNATMLSPPGIYPIAGSLAGPAATNYILAPIIGGITIAKAPASLAITSSTASALPGVAIVLSAQLATPTSGVPTGTITFLSGSSTLATTSVPQNGIATATISTLPSGSNSIVAIYSGDADFLSTTSAPVVVTIGTLSSPDFTLASVGTNTQTVPAGTSATFTFATQTSGTSLASAITLAVSGLPVGATASFSPGYIPPGNAATSFTLVIATSAAAAHAMPLPHGPPSYYLTSLSCFILPGILLWRRRSAVLPGMLAILALGVLATFAAGCGDRVNTAAQISTNLRTYPLQVTGTATSPTGTILQHTATVTLQIE
jgi:sugar lactone lactonase YvrE